MQRKLKNDYGQDHVEYTRLNSACVQYRGIAFFQVDSIGQRPLPLQMGLGDIGVGHATDIQNDNSLCMVRNRSPRHVLSVPGIPFSGSRLAARSKWRFRRSERRSG